MTTFTATYSPEDNKLRLYASSRLDADTYARVKAAGFKWAPRQELFVAPMWTPAREDLLLELAGELDDEDTSLVDRAEQRADRFDGYQDRRRADASAAAAAADAIGERFAGGQPILVGHHSERRARKDKEHMDGAMRRAVKMWDTADYWKQRAAGAIHHAKYKELPTVRARRIKTIEADRRRVLKSKTNAVNKLALWSLEGLTQAQAIDIANRSHGGPFVIEANGQRWDAWHVLQPDGERYSACPAVTLADVVAKCKAACAGYLPTADRWLAHYDNRLTYERAMLEEQGAAQLLEPKPRRELPPLLNYRAPAGTIECKPYGNVVTYRQVEMTKAAYAKVPNDYRGARWSLDRSHRFRICSARFAEPGAKSFDYVAVFLTDSKAHAVPSSSTPQPEPPAPPAAAAPVPPPADVDQVDDVAPLEAAPAPSSSTPAAAAIDAMRATLKAGGVRVVVAPQLFATPLELGARVIELADIEAGHRVLEPSAGTGMLLMHLPAGVHIVACEVNAALVEGLKSFCRPIATLIHGDFLDMVGADPGFDRIVMNPPFENGADIKHIEHARRLLKPVGRLVAICAGGPRQERALRPLASHWEPLPAAAFKSAGTMVNTVLLAIDAPALAEASAPAPQLALL